jgi:hypothetical protein
MPPIAQLPWLKLHLTKLSMANQCDTLTLDMHKPFDQAKAYWANQGLILELKSFKA